MSGCVGRVRGSTPDPPAVEAKVRYVAKMRAANVRVDFEPVDRQVRHGLGKQGVVEVLDPGPVNGDVAGAVDVQPIFPDVAVALPGDGRLDVHDVDTDGCCVLGGHAGAAGASQCGDVDAAGDGRM